MKNSLPNTSRAIAFDFDGTLADTMQTHTISRISAFEEMSRITGDKRYATVPLSVHESAHMHGTVSREIIGWILLQMGIIDTLDNPALDQLILLKKQHHHSSRLPMTKDTPCVLNNARTRFGDLVGIVTTAHRKEVVGFLRENNLGEYISSDLIVTIDDIQVSKPSPDMYTEFLNRADIKPYNAIAVEDAHKGIESARRAGLYTIGVATTHTQHELEVLTDYQKPDAIAEDLAAVCDMLLDNTE